MNYTTSQKVTGSIPNELIEFFNLPNPCSRIMAFVSTQSPTSNGIRVLPLGGGVKRGRCVWLTTSLLSVSRVSRKCLILDVTQPYRQPQKVTKVTLPLGY
jgi:hypothetical protein